MKILKKLFYLFSGLIFLSGLLMLLFMLNPGLTDNLSDRLYGRGGRTEAARAEPGRDPSGSGAEPGGRDRDGPGDADDPDRAGPNAGGTGSAGAESAASGEDGTGEAAENASESENAEYVPPPQEDIETPEAVAERGGYVPVQEEAQEIGEEEAGLLLESTGYGETGDGLAFDPVFYPYYQMLNPKGQHLYRQMYANAMELNDTFVPIEQAREKEIKDAYLAVYNDHPELFWLDGGYTGKCLPNGICAEMTLLFNRTAGNLEQASEEFREAARKVLEAVEGADTEYETELALHQAVLDRTDYRLNAPMNQSAYSALVNGQSVCAGYSRALQYVLQQAGIPSYYCTGYAGVDHAWNIVLLDGEYYNVDATWNDTDPNTLDYFNKTDRDFASTHVRQELSVYLPACRGKRYAVLTGAAAVPEGDVVHSLQEYYNDCYERALQNVGGEVIEFENYLSGDALMEQWNQVYEQEAYVNGYVNHLLTDIGVRSCELNVQVDQVGDELYRLRHKIRLIP